MSNSAVEMADRHRQYAEQNERPSESQHAVLESIPYRAVPGSTSTDERTERERKRGGGRGRQRKRHKRRAQKKRRGLERQMNGERTMAVFISGS